VRDDEAGQKVRDQLEAFGLTVDTIHATPIYGTRSYIVDGSGFQHFVAKSFSALVDGDGVMSQLQVWTPGDDDAFRGL